MTACATCQSWAIKTSSLKAADFAPCDLGPRYTAYPPQHNCARHTPLGQVLFVKRTKWLERINEKHQSGVTA